MQITSIRTAGLGDTTYVFEHEGRGIVIDPQRDVDRFLPAVGEVDVRFVFETHLHNDYVSGGIALAEATGADLVLPAASGAAYRHVAAFHLEDLDTGTFTVRPIHTPGHTPEHTSYLVLVDGEPVVVFSGGSLLVGSAGRPDLLGMHRADSLARLQYNSVNRLAELPDEVGLYPTHGEGSFCTVSTTSAISSTIGVERATNPVLQYDDVDGFVKAQLSVLQPYPDYYAHMGPLNLIGPTPPPARATREIAATEIPPGAAVIDIRPRADFAAGHLPGSIGIELSDQTAVWAGWLVEFDAPIVLVANHDQTVAEAAVQFSRIGFDHVFGVVYELGEEGGLNSFRTAPDAELAAEINSGRTPQIVDVRAPNEWEAGHVEGSSHRYVPDLRDGLPPDIVADSDVWLICRTGHRAVIAAGLVERLGARPVVVTKGGVDSVLALLEAGAAE
jgi:rhodanese-related sulfurtransferase/glyoxylase-like metal-dependent hydrolase (beta-lactamase superfamily II)